MRVPVSNVINFRLVSVNNTEVAVFRSSSLPRVYVDYFLVGVAGCVKGNCSVVKRLWLYGLFLSIQI